jgi:subtilisin family serine protease
MRITTIARATRSCLRSTLPLTPRRARGLRRLLAAGLAAALLPLAAAAPAARADRLIVKPRRGAVSATAAQAVQGARVQRTFHQLGNLQVLQLPAGLPVQAALARLRQSQDIEYAEPDYTLQLQGTAPNDFRYGTGELWGLHNTGYLGGTPGADIKAYEAWDIRREAPGVIVALVDSGVRLTHEDLAPNLWRNPREIPGNGIDDDNNGVIDDVFGFNAFADNGNPADDLGHGTHVAGTIGAAGNNALGVVGVAWKVQLMATKFTGPDGNGTLSDAIACIDYARRMGAHIINASWGASWFESTALREAIQAARDAGIVFVTVAGNNSADNDATPVYPGAYGLDNIIVATATDRFDQLAFFANYGARSVHLGAPGYNIFSTWIGSDADYQYYDGGSMAAAHVSGAMALLRAQFPGDTPAQLIARVLKNTDPLPSLVGKTSSGGRLDLFRALGGVVSLPALSIAAADASASENPGDTATLTISRTGPIAAPLTIAYTVSGSATSGVDFQALPGSLTIPAGASTATLTLTPIDDTLHEPTETVTVSLLAGAGYTLGTAASATLALLDNDPAPPANTVVVAATDPNAAETGSDPGTFTLTRTGATDAALTVAFTLGGSATAGNDYAALGTSATIPAGASSTTIIVRPIDDTLVEGPETITITLAADSAYTLGTNASATITLADNDTAPRAEVSVQATKPWTIELDWFDGEFQVSRTGNTAQPLTVRLAFSGSATNGADYARLPESITIPAGRSAVAIAVSPLRDRKVEGLETVVASVVAGESYTIAGNARATVSIVDDDLLWWFIAQVFGGGR